MNTFIPLDLTKLRHHLSQFAKLDQINFHLFDTLDSTNTYLKNTPCSAPISICCAEQQTKGRGRFGRTWVSPFGENIYLSTRLQLPIPTQALSCLSLVIGLAVITALSPYLGDCLSLKWPNDILWGEKKLCGILLELCPSAIIIGIGLNVNTATQTQSIEGKPWCSLYEISGRKHDRNELIARIIEAQDAHLQTFLQQGFEAFAASWDRLDCLKGKIVQVGEKRGLALGVTALGQLRLLAESQEELLLSSGEIA